MTVTRTQLELGPLRARWRSTEALIFLAYYCLFMAYNFVVREPDPMHWLGLVLVPFALVYLCGRRVRGDGPRAALASVGLRRGTLRSGLLLALVVGLALSCVQLLISDKRHEIWPIITSGKILVYLPLVVVLLFVTAGFTEEFFFRGVLQTRLAAWWGRELWAAIAAAVLFGLYHFPYLYFLSSSSLRGHALGALGECGMDALAGLAIGLVYWRSRKNLLAAVLTHVLIDVLPALTLIHFGPR
jgi:membrane protease YdiL (CAAX protease family)